MSKIFTICVCACIAGTRARAVYGVHIWINPSTSGQCVFYTFLRLLLSVLNEWSTC